MIQSGANVACSRPSSRGTQFAIFRAFSVFAALVTFTNLAKAGQVVTVCFTPGEDCAGLVVREIGAARNQVLAQAYSFTHYGIARALVDAKRRGVNVVAMVDKDQEREFGGASALARKGGVPVVIDGAHDDAHNKVIVIDGYRTITGSFNFTKKAQDGNAENLVVIDGMDVAARYIDNFKTHLGHSTR